MFRRCWPGSDEGGVEMIRVRFRRRAGVREGAAAEGACFFLRGRGGKGVVAEVNLRRWGRRGFLHVGVSLCTLLESGLLSGCYVLVLKERLDCKLCKDRKGKVKRGGGEPIKRRKGNKTRTLLFLRERASRTPANDDEPPAGVSAAGPKRCMCSVPKIEQS